MMGWAVLMLCLLSGVRVAAQSSAGTTLVVDPIEPRIDVIAGSMLVAPVRVVGDASSVKTLQARLDDGRRVEALLRCV